MKTKHSTGTVLVLLLGTVAFTTPTAYAKESAPEATEYAPVLPGGTEGAELPSMTVTGENRIRIEFDRPTLELDLDPTSAPGLEWGDPLAILERERIDLEGPLLGHSAKADLAPLADPWARELRTGDVARFQAKLEGATRWRLVIVSSRSDTVATFSGNGDPPKEIAWDGTTEDGGFASPGLVYSYALEAEDRAGTRRTFVGPGFRLPAYRGEHEDDHVILLTGDHLPADWARSVPREIPNLLLEAATLANRFVPDGDPIEIRVAAPTFAQAESIARSVSEALSARLLGDPHRLRAVARAQSGAPESGEIAIVLAERAQP